MKPCFPSVCMHVSPPPMWVLCCLMLCPVPLWQIRDPLFYFHRLFKGLVFKKSPTFLLKLVKVRHWLPELLRGSGQTHVYVEHKDTCFIFIGNLATNLEWGLWWCVRVLSNDWFHSVVGPKKHRKAPVSDLRPHLFSVVHSTELLCASSHREEVACVLRKYYII